MIEEYSENRCGDNKSEREGELTSLEKFFLKCLSCITCNRQFVDSDLQVPFQYYNNDIDIMYCNHCNAPHECEYYEYKGETFVKIIKRVIERAE